MPLGGTSLRVPPQPASQQAPKPAKIRATQTIVSHMSFCWSHPSLTAIEVGWRWLFGIPFLLILFGQAQKILAKIPPSTAGLDRLSFQNPWLTSLLLVNAAGVYHHSVVAVLHWLVPAAIVAWAILSGIGRTIVLRRLQALDPDSNDPIVHLPRRSLLTQLLGMIALQAFWMVALVCCWWIWYRSLALSAATHITAASEPDLVGYLCWLIFFSLSIFTAWALFSWALSIAPILFVQTSSLSPSHLFATLTSAFRLGRPLSSKLAEVNLVMAIVKIALLVLAMVFSAAPLPFSDQFGPDALNALYCLIAIAFLIANDYFHIVRLRSFRDLWRSYKQV